MPDEPPPKSSSSLSPAAWTALSAIAVAVITAVVTLTTAFWDRSPPPAAEPAKPSAAAQAEPAKAAAVAEAAKAEEDGPAAWVGRWRGEAMEPSGARFTVEVEIEPECRLGAVCGRIAVPHVPCRGDLTLAGARAGGYEFSVDNFDARSNDEVCKPGGGEVLSAGAGGTLVYYATYSGATGQLRRLPR